MYMYIRNSVIFKLSLIIFFVYSFFIKLPNLIFAENKAVNIRCLQAKTVQPDPLHHVELTGGGFPNNTDVYIIDCIGSINDNRCTADKPFSSDWGTSANRILDTTVTDKLATLGLKLNPEPVHFLLVNEGNPVRAVNNEIKVHAGGSSPKASQVRFYGVFFQDIPAKFTGQGGQQQGSFTFEGATGDCASILWDPYGKVFDSVSLEPLLGATINLLNQNKTLYKQLGIQNPQITSVDGEYSYYVSNGTYYLSPSKINYRFPLIQSDINSNYTKAYSDIYFSQESFIENNEIVHKDIPLFPLSKPYESAPSIVEYGTLRIPETSALRIEGKVSHPLTVVKFTQQGQSLAQVSADKSGFFSVDIPDQSINNNSPIKTQLIKVDLRTNKQTAAINSSLVVEPILSELKGYVYDNNNLVIPHAQVNLRLRMSDAIYYSSEADANGYFEIPAAQIPIFSYYLEYVNPVNSNKLTQSSIQFSSHGSIHNKPVNMVNSSNTSQNTQKNTNMSNNVMIYIVVLSMVFVIIIVFLLIFLYRRIKSKNTLPK